MKKIFQFLVSLTLVIGSAFNTLSATAAPSRDKGEFTLAQLGLESDIVLHGPYDTNVMRFDLPATWDLQPGAELALNVKSIVTGSKDLLQSTYSGGMLEVYFNGKFQESIPLLSNSETTYYVPIAASDLISPNPGGWHQLSFILRAELDCTVDFHQTTVAIDSASVATFPYQPAALSLDLRRLPWPIYLQHVKQQEPVSVVVPAAPTADEMQAALVVMGALGRMTQGKLPLTMITADKFSKDLPAQPHLILVGKPSGFPMFKELHFPVPLANDQFSAPELKTDDGVLQMVPSPWDNTKAVLVVSGNSDLAVVKAAQALSTLNLQTGNTPDYSIVAKVSPAPAVGIAGPNSAASRSADVKLADLGYTTVTITGVGLNWNDYQFTIPLGMVPDKDPYLSLNFSVSSLVDVKRSEGVVYLNEVQIGSVPLSEATSNLITTKIDLPPSLLRPGTNDISVVLNLLPYEDCLTVFDVSSLWATIYSDSVIHLPLVESPDSSFALPNLKGYPYPFAMDPSLSTTAFILSKQDSASWLQAGRIAYDLGARVPGSVVGFEAAFDGEIPDDLHGMNLIVVGEPRNINVLSDLKNAMPASFDKGSNIALLDSQQVVYRISDKKSLGYLQLFPSTWNNQRAVLGVFGTTPAGLVSAMDALLDFKTRDTFSGNFVTMDGSKAHIVDTRTGAGLGNIIISLNPSVAPKPTQEAGNSGLSNAQITFAKSQQMILAGAGLVVILIIITTAIALWLRRKRL